MRKTLTNSFSGLSDTLKPIPWIIVGVLIGNLAWDHWLSVYF